MSASPQAFEVFENYADYSTGGYDYVHQYQKATQSQESEFDFFYDAADVAAPHPDLFEKELDSTLSFVPELQLNNLIENFALPYHPAVITHRSPMGPPSSITSDSASGYRDDESAYSYSHSAYSYVPVDLGLEMDLQNVRLEKRRHSSEYGPSITVDPTSFGVVADMSPPQTFSDYSPSVMSASSNYYPPLDYAHRTTSHAKSDLGVDTKPKAAGAEDPSRRFKCSQCPRSFARAYNLKTHMATHDPNRSKPHVCSHAGCGRSFSRKHDLGRHLFSIHKEGLGASVGVEAGARSWCDACGRGLVGKAACACNDAD